MGLMRACISCNSVKHLPRCEDVGSYLYSYNLISFLLLPLSAIYWLLYKLHRMLYSRGLLKTVRISVPVIIVGNLTVGGTGKTPLVAWLANYLVLNGFKPGIISRGYGGNGKDQPVRVEVNSDPRLTGDEPVVLARKTGCPVYVFPDRARAAAALLRENNCNILISDDGLQHYRLQRDIEIVVIDGLRRFGNRFLLPAGPMRESVRRLKTVDYVFCRSGLANESEIPYSYTPDQFINLHSKEERGIYFLKGKKVHAITGIGNPQQFLDLLRQLGMDIIPHIYPDHHRFKVEEMEFGDEIPVVMTEKDAVKCGFINKSKFWYLSIKADLPTEFGSQLLHRLHKEPHDG